MYLDQALPILKRTLRGKARPAEPSAILFSSCLHFGLISCCDSSDSLRAEGTDQRLGAHRPSRGHLLYSLSVMMKGRNKKKEREPLNLRREAENKRAKFKERGLLLLRISEMFAVLIAGC